MRLAGTGPEDVQKNIDRGLIFVVGFKYPRYIKTCRTGGELRRAGRRGK